MKILVLMIVLGFGSAAIAGAELILTEGEPQSIHLNSSRGPIRVGQSRVIRIVAAGSRFLIIPRKPGKALITHSDGSLTVHVLSRNDATTYHRIKSAMSGMMGLSLRVAEGTIVVEGELLRLSDWQRLWEAARESSGRWQMRASVDRRIRGEAQRWLEARLRSSGLLRGELLLDPRPELIVAPNDEKAIVASAETQALGLKVRADPLTIETKALVRIRLYFVETQNTDGVRLGLGLSDGQDIQLLPTLSGPRELTGKLNWMKERGYGKVVAAPQITTRDGQEAEFLSGGEFAVRTGRHRQGEVAWKRHGLWLKLKPRLDRNQKITIEINSEYSLPDYANAVDGVPSIRTSRANSQADLRSGQTLVLAGLKLQTNGNSTTGPVGLMDVPVLGRMLRAEQRQDRSSDLLILIQPEILMSGADQPQEVEWD